MRPSSSVGAWSLNTRVSVSAIAMATGSASCCQKGIVARTHWVRDIALPEVASDPKVCASSIQSAATVNARSAAPRSASVGVSATRPADVTACSVATDQSMVPSAFCMAPRNCDMSCSSPAPPPGSPIALAI